MTKDVFDIENKLQSAEFIQLIVDPYQISFVTPIGTLVVYWEAIDFSKLHGHENIENGSFQLLPLLHFELKKGVAIDFRIEAKELKNIVFIQVGGLILSFKDADKNGSYERGNFWSEDGGCLVF